MERVLLAILLYTSCKRKWSLDMGMRWLRWFHPYGYPFSTIILSRAAAAAVIKKGEINFVQVAAKH